MMRTHKATAPTRDQVSACRILIEHSVVAVEDGERLLGSGDDQYASIRLFEAAQLLRLAAHKLDSEVSV
jgi:hypothetical protein